MTSTIVGKSGRIYIRREVLAERRDPRLSVFKAEFVTQNLTYKIYFDRTKPFYNLSLRLAADFPESRRLRMHVDSSEEENFLIYPFYQHTLLGLLQDDPEVSRAAQKRILQETGAAIQELHSKDWIHRGDFNLAFKFDTGALLYNTRAVGNIMWRSPEGQTGRGLSKASDVYSFGLCIYTLGGREPILINDYPELAKHGVSPQHAVLTRHFSYFGPANQGLLNVINNKKWTKALTILSKETDLVVQDYPDMSFEAWGHVFGSGAQKMISGMTKIDPRARATIGQVMEHPW
ncbi:hypothetical protein COCMIDRAFT_39214 [Bipolaris oryzae ATCC 44560]|uniref:Protein kinase domain-containing protein n=1 Tax=Bipolaris oryzae ATCC 44560 TaxID=930090 RepID=W6YYU0_COCMI|nr:uncharacterized protein COCMIDRAFT_39214 [Bipolaris oryzae ATCC 44560]EUC42743.1 hypothetical protein COCMIDRAFT_39214 [Bipolaris oryzae ATCC 44560]